MAPPPPLNVNDFRPIAAAPAFRARQWLGLAVADERARWALWVPVAFGVGIAVYFALPDEPPWWLGVVMAIAVGAVAAFGYRGFAAGRGTWWFMAGLGLVLIAAGFAVAQIRAVAVAAPVLAERIGPTTLTGQVVEVEAFPEATRVTLEKPRIARVPAHRTPERVRVRLSRHTPVLAPGDWITVRAVLLPPPAPAAPGAFDFQRQAFFRGIGAVGFAVGTPDVTPAATADVAASFNLALQRLRQRITETVMEALGGGATGAVTAALLTGDRSAIPKDVIDAMRDAGLAHLLAISGINIGLAAGVLFVGLRGVLALIPPLALRYPIKKWAAVAAIPGAFAYALIAGASVPTQRSFLMLGFVMLAVLVDRRGISMRLVAWAAIIVLTLQPESLLGPSFQMSFAAVVALIAGWEAWSERRLDDTPPFWQRGVTRYLVGVVATTMIAGAATAPFALYHFNRYAMYGLVANMIAVPATALWIMPWAVVAFLLMPFGLEGLGLVPMGWGVALVNEVAKVIAAWPGSVALLPAMPTWGLALVTFGGLWLCLWRRRWRLAGLGAVAAGMLSIALVRPPDMLVDAGGLVAVRTGDGTLAVSSVRAGRFTREMWLRQAGLEADAAEAWPRAGASADRRLSCDALGCLYRAHGHTIAVVRDRAALIEDCWAARLVVSTAILGRQACTGSARVIDGRDLRRHGAHALWLAPENVRIESVNDSRGRRPWVLRGGGRGYR